MSLFDRTEILIGRAGIEALRESRVAVYGLGGVGAACAMDLVRSGIGQLYVVDFDTVEESNLNRLYFGYRSMIGKPKVDAFIRYAKEVNPDILIEARRIFFSGEDASSIIDSESGIHADCIDSLNAKVNLIAELSRRETVFIASMGTAGRLAPEKLKLGSMWHTRGCPLAKSVRTRLRHMGVRKDFPVVWSDEPPVKPVAPSQAQKRAHADAAADTAADADAPFAPAGRQRMVQGSGPFVPQTAGHMMASWIVRRILTKAAAEREDP